MGLFRKEPNYDDMLMEAVVKSWEMSGNAKDFLKEIQDVLELEPEKKGYQDKIVRISFQLELITIALKLKILKDRQEDRKVLAERIIELGEEIKNI